MTRLKKHWTILWLISKWIIFIVCLLIFFQAVSKEKEQPIYQCVKWRYKNYITFEAECIEWRIKDCSKRMYQSICKLGV